MNFKLFILYCFLLFSKSVYCQTPEVVYKQPLKAVLQDIAKKYNVKLVYEDKNVKDVSVLYASWRYRTDVKETLRNILSTVDLVFNEKSKNEFEITKFEYYRKTFDEGKMHLERLLASYPALTDWELRKKELRKDILEALNLSPLPKKTPLNPVYTVKRVMDGYTVENVAIETLPASFFVARSTNHPLVKVLFLQCCVLMDISITMWIR